MREMNSTGIVWCPSIPSDWEVRRVKDCFYISKVKAGTKNPVVLKLARSGVQVKDVTVNGGQMAESYDDYNPVQVGDLLLNPMDLYSGANCNVSEVEGVISPAYVNLRAKETLNPYYFDYYFKIQYWTMAMFAHCKGVSYDNRWTINAESVKAYELPFPSVSEQNAIVDIIKRKSAHIDALISNAQQQIEKLKAYKQRVITETVTKGLDPDVTMKDSGYDFIGMIPASWKICKLRHIGTPQNGISKGGEFFGTGFPFVSYGDIYKNFTLPETVDGLVNTTETERKQYSVECGDIFFTRTSETIEEVGFSCVCEKTIPDATFAGFVIRVRPFNDKLLTGFAKYYFRSSHHRFYLVKEMNLVTRASLSQGLLKSMPVLVPPKTEQQEISDYLDHKCSQIDKLIALKQQKIEKLQQYKKSLIYEYVTGKKEV